MENEKKFTKVEKFGMVEKILTGELDVDAETIEMLVEFVKAESERISKANHRPSDPKKVKAENEAVLEALALFSEPAQVKALLKTDIFIEHDFSSQKATTILGRLVREGVVVKTEGKGKVSLYALA